MEFRVLGPVEVWGSAGRARLGGATQLALLSSLIVQANRAVPSDRIMETTWEERPPTTVDALYNGLFRLRRALEAAEPGGAERIVTGPNGYMLRIEPGELDLDVFRETVQRARAAADAERYGEAARIYEEALSLWRGSALSGVPGRFAQAQAASLNESHVDAAEEYMEVRLASGEHTVLVPELNRLVSAHPLRERLRGQLMLALYRAGRQADALASFRELRGLLAEELGIQPTPAIQRLHQRILSADPELRTPAPTSAERPAQSSTPLPRQLPADVVDFTGREEYLDKLDSLLADVGEREQTVVISTIAGVAGVGKTALALHWAHRITNRLPDGQLYLNLRGYAPTAPMVPTEALTRLLRALGVPREKIPEGQDEQAALYRSILADRRTLVMLDNAASPDQVRPLLPGTSSCLVIVTSRDDLRGLTALDGARRLVLDLFSGEEAHELLTRVIGEQRVAAEEEAAAELVRLCGRLPLALRIAAAHLASYESQTIAEYLSELTEDNRLTRLAIEEDPEVAVRASFDLSYQRLAPQAARLFRMLGLVPGPDFTLPAASALAGTDQSETSRLLDRLIAAHLVEAHVPGRFQLHDLLRLYAGERGAQIDSEEERAQARHRLLTWYLQGADAASHLLNPTIVRLPREHIPEGRIPIASDTQALAWVEVERANLIAAIKHAAEHGPRSFAWHLADTLRGYFYFRMTAQEWVDTAEIALQAARDADDADGEAAMLHSLAHAHFSRGAYEQTLSYGNPARDYYRRTGRQAAEAEVLKWSGLACWLLGRFDESLEYLVPARECYRHLGNLSGEANILNSISLVHMELGQFQQALDHDIEALAMQEKLGSRFGQGVSRQVIGRACAALGRYDEAAEHQGSALDIYRHIGYRYGEATVLNTRSVVFLDTGRYDDAMDHAEQSHALACEIDVPAIQADALNAQAAVHHALGRPEKVLKCSGEALSLAREVSFPRGIIDALVLLASAHRCLGDHETALAHADEAVRDAHERKFRQCEGQALAELAAITFARQDPDGAETHARRALDLHRDTGYRIGQAHALRLLGDVLRSRSGADAALPHWQEALEIYTDLGAPEADDVRERIAAG